MIQISFIIPVYNATPYLDRSLGSIFALGIPEDQMEIICVDDCSPDNTVEVISAIAEQHPSVHLLRHTVNKRQGAGVNTGIRYAHGEYAIIMGQDDEILPTLDLLGQIEYMRQNDLEILLGRAVCDDGKGNRTYWANVEKESDIMKGSKLFCDDFINQIAFGVTWIAIFKMDLIKRSEPFAENVIYEDADWCFRCAYNAKRVQYKPFDIYLYFNNPDSCTHNFNAQKLEWKVRQSLRVHHWAQHVTEEVDAVHLIAEDFCTWNSSGVKVLWKFPIAEQRKFFKAFTKDDYRIFRLWPSVNMGVKILQHPNLAQIVLSFMTPFIRVTWSIRHILK